MRLIRQFMLTRSRLPVGLRLFPARTRALACQSSLAAVEPGSTRRNRGPCAGDRLSGTLLPGRRGDPGQACELVSPRFALIGRLLTLVGSRFALIGGALAFIGGALAFIGGALAFIGRALALATVLFTRVRRLVTSFGVHTYKDAARRQTAANRRVTAPDPERPGQAEEPGLLRISVPGRRAGRSPRRSPPPRPRPTTGSTRRCGPAGRTRSGPAAAPSGSQGRRLRTSLLP